MVKLKLQRIGKKKEPHFRLIVQDSKKDPHDKSVEILGWLNPRTKEKQIKKERVEYWLSKGAQPTDTVHNLLVSAEIIKDKKRKTFTISKKRREKMESKDPNKAQINPDENSDIKKSETPMGETEESKKTEEPKEEKKKTNPPANDNKETQKPTEEPKKTEEGKEEKKETNPPANKEGKAEESPSAEATADKQENKKTTDSADEDKKE